MIAAERLREIVNYDATTGCFAWRLKRQNGAKPGDSAGSKRSDGYVYISVDGERHMAHRLAWLFTHGTWPAGDIDHINGVRDDNRIANLRDVSRATNMQNQRRARSDSRSGVLGVSFDASTGTWRATLLVDGRRKSLGAHDTPEQAHAAYVAAKRQFHPGNTL